MAETTTRQRPERAAVYWRRRVAVLVISMSVLAGITWSAAAVLGGAAHPAKAAADRSRLPAGPSAQASSGAAATGMQNAVAADSRLAEPVRPAGRLCPASDVVVTLSATQPSYSAWQQPEFVIDLVSWASHPCSVDVGAAHVLLQISASPGQVWTSADCAEGLASQPTTLHRSVPVVVAMTWDEQYSSPGCPVPGRAAPAGSYTARATDASAVSNDVTFTTS